MEENNCENFLDIFKNTEISKTKKFCFKKVVKNTECSTVEASTTSPFFAKNSVTVQSKDSQTNKSTSTESIKSTNLTNVEEQLSKIFNEVSEATKPVQRNSVSFSNNRLKFNFKNTISANCKNGLTNQEVFCDKTHKCISAPLSTVHNENLVTVRNSLSEKDNAVRNSVNKPSVSNLTKWFTAKTEFNKSPLNLSKTNSDSVCAPQATNKTDCNTVLNTFHSKKDICYQNSEGIKSESAKNKFQFKKKPLKCNLSVDNKTCETTSDKHLSCQQSSVKLNDFVSDNVFNKTKAPKKEQTVESSDECDSSPVIKPKKFTFKKKLSSTSSSGLSQLSTKKIPEDTNTLNSKSHLIPSLIQCCGKEKTPEKKKYTSRKERSHISISSTSNESVSDVEKNVSINVSKVKKDLFSNQINLDDEIALISESLNATDADFMDDEEFERIFGKGNSSISVSNKVPLTKTLTSDEIDLNDVDWDEQFDLEHHKNLNTENILDEISDINWNEDAFSETVFTPANSFSSRNDASKQFTKKYHFSQVVMEILNQKFGLRKFRPHQLEVINASLNRHDCFVLMPTGGGKSLCYQLPAILSEGVTIVISPLRALISDQVDKLNALDIPAAHLCSDISKEETNQILSKLHSREPLIKLLYLTPEKIMAAKSVMELLNSLYQRGKLARFVIDEAHCLSHWGHDFRPDYKQLSLLRKQFKEVPIICLTATATKQVEQDVTNILKLKTVKTFIRSFNRPNIKYEVIPKKGKLAVNELANLIKHKFFKKSGIIYCLARKDCDILAEKLNSVGIKTKPYHAGMNDKVRERIQREWMQDQFYVIVATIAFGMGIDKPDVRFVIHNSVPKSVEAFYQESGRAGRDGETSYSYLFYSYVDVARLKKLLVMDRNNKSTLNAHFENLQQMVSFAENVVDCRRHLQLLHLGESFDRRKCIQNKATTCDNCENFNNYSTLDVTKEAKELGTLVQDLSSKGGVTLLYIADVYRGSKQAKIFERGHESHKYYGVGKEMSRTDVHRILKDLILKNILADHHMYTGDFPVVYIRPGPKFNSLNSLNIKIVIPMAKSAPKADISYPELNIQAAKAGTSTSTATTVPNSTAISTSKVKQAAISKFKISKIKVQCHEELLEECRRLALQKNVTLSSIMNLSALKSMSEVLPITKEEILKIQHVTNANYNKYGEFFLNITKKFRTQVDSLQVIPEPKSLDDSSFDDVWRSPGKGIKRKSNWTYKRGAKKPRKSRQPRKPRQPKKSRKQKQSTSTNTKKATVKGKKGNSGLMPIHIK